MLPARFYMVAFIAVALSVAGFALSFQSEDSAVAAGAGVVAAVGFVVCAWMLKQQR
jgi:hypothetical protein